VSGVKKIDKLFSLVRGRSLQALALSALLSLGLLVMPSAVLADTTIDVGETLTNPVSTTLTNDSLLTNNGTLTNSGTLTNAAGGMLTNLDTLLNDSGGRDTSDASIFYPLCHGKNAYGGI
jgi:hypothetical protein